MIRLKKLLQEQKVEVNLPYQMDQISIYTVKLFDKYVRI